MLDHLKMTSHGFEYGVKHFLSPCSGAIKAVLSLALGLNNEDALFLVQLGAVYVNHLRLLNPAELVKENDLIQVHTKPRRYFLNYDWKSLIVFENQDFLVCYKPSNLPSHPSVDNQVENILTQLNINLNKNLKLTHRLDSMTEGLIVFGKTENFVKIFNQNLQKKLVHKNYVALVETDKKLPEKVIHYMEPSPRAPKNVSDIYHEKWALCELEIIDQKKYLSQSWVKINLLTGRTHQIRSQMKALSASVLGDQLYKSTIEIKNKNSEPTIALRAQMIEFSWANQIHRFEISPDFEYVF